MAYFNPARFANKLTNFRLFRQSLALQGLRLVAVELVHDDAAFELQKEDAEILVQRRGGDVMWQKERLLNVALDHLPPDCDKVVWLDADVLFQNRHWVADTAALLERYAFVQPFSLVFQLPQGCTSLTDCRKPTLAGKVGTVCGWSHQEGWLAGSPGYAMAARRNVLTAHGLYDRMILGGGDRVILSAAMGIDPGAGPHIGRYPASLVDDASQWCRRVSAAIGRSLYYTEGNLLHLWHGTFADRRYGKRTRLLEGFNVHEDIRVDSQGLWSWSSDKPALHEAVRRYFQLRNEEGRPRRWWQKPRILPVRRLFSSLFPSRLHDR